MFLTLSNVVGDLPTTASSHHDENTGMGTSPHPNT
jgi:hypothetical protein